MSKLKLSFMALLVFCLTLLGGAGALAAENDNRIAVSAGAIMEVAPDMAYINFTAKGEGNTAAEAVNAAAKQMEAARRSLLGLNIVGQDVATINYYTNAVFDAKGKRTGYAAENIVRVTVKDITKVGAVIDKSSGFTLVPVRVRPSAPVILAVYRKIDRFFVFQKMQLQ